MEPFAGRIRLPRQHRTEAASLWAGRYAQRLAHYATRFPLQWYNFYDFWADRPPQAIDLHGISAPQMDTHGQNSQSLT